MVGLFFEISPPPSAPPPLVKVLRIVQLDTKYQ